MIDPLPDDLARLFASERALPAADGARQAAVRARLWKTLGWSGGGAPPPRGGGGFGAGGFGAGAVGARARRRRHVRRGAAARAPP